MFSGVLRDSQHIPYYVPSLSHDWPLYLEYIQQRICYAALVAALSLAKFIALTWHRRHTTGIDVPRLGTSHLHCLPASRTFNLIQRT